MCAECVMFTFLEITVETVLAHEDSGKRHSRQGQRAEEEGTPARSPTSPLQRHRTSKHRNAFAMSEIKQPIMPMTSIINEQHQQQHKQQEEHQSQHILLVHSHSLKIHSLTYLPSSCTYNTTQYNTIQCVIHTLLESPKNILLSNCPIPKA